MADTPDPSAARDWRDTVFLPKTAFPMKAGLPQKEPAILAKWQADDLYAQTRATRAGAPKFILHDGPPYANGDMHIGHALNHILKDMVVRTQTLLGKDAPYVPGWDCHGLPIEWKVEEQYRKQKRNKDEVPLPEFRAECRAYAQNWVNVQREQLKRLGINGDWDKPYLTMDFAAEATIVTELLKFAASGQLYRGAKPVMWSPVEKTALAEAEVEYEDVTSTQIDVAFEIVESAIEDLVGAHAVIWTTTPWTIPVNQALAYGPDVEYVLARFDSIHEGPRTLLVALDLLESFGARIGHPVVVKLGDAPGTVTPLRSIMGRELAGTIARHPMHHLGAFFARPRPLLAGDFVTTDAGTGLVHMAPDHGEDDFLLCKANGLEPVFAVEADGRYRADWAWLGGQGSVINPKFTAPDGPICTDLAETGALMAASADFRHSYPHSWRSKAKVIFRATPQWFIGMDRPLSPSPLGGEGRGEGARGEAERSDAEGGAPSPNPLPQGRGLEGEGLTLRQTALAAIADTRFVPEKGRNRIGAMVEGRPDWVISRQRAWGVPITLFVERRSGQYLVDEAVNARIVAAVRERGVDAWDAEGAQALLGDAYDLADYERATDILDVWFDSGCTHAFVLESGKWPELSWPADLYLEGSDQHRGWFQSSLLESCGTRGRAPYNAVLTHGFTMDQKGMKMSKSLGNTVDPIALMKDHGADILRLWALSIDFTEDHRIGKEILTGISDTYRKLRNSFRYLLGALDGFAENETVAPAEMPGLERYMLHLLAELDAELRAATDAFEFNRYVRALTDFCNNDLSAFFFDIRKDSLYCDAPTDPKRRAYRTVLDILFHALVRYAAPVLVFTAEEVWGTRFPETGSVHLLTWPAVDAGWRDDDLRMTWERLRTLRTELTGQIEPLRRDKVVGSSLEVDVTALAYDQADLDLLRSVDFAEIAITAPVKVSAGDVPIAEDVVRFEVAKTDYEKCGRCWRHLPEVTEDGALCARCTEVVGG
ncbi:isoleucine--tRNA ligase [Sphingomonas nostoxanthinifaciens]|uniref:isoleucine--tRNA ligase n=1 Tax=Sphingomonas nostoxanthinifaciens TaxID=2872652 RepID=UPI001CC1E616|nr:isoleucine--tRNA ligase [Sphingomonas nostoxanthinifaciens]UAK24891.1 isoleucine--tRNA ligase [Sphingomonas nostoxanthinifaciens]